MHFSAQFIILYKDSSIQQSSVAAVAVIVPTVMSCFVFLTYFEYNELSSLFFFLYICYNISVFVSFFLTTN